ncbi:MAG TPA: hypothetical protein ENH37_10900 [Deltaproteobacteria bacterium]|nr:PilZ domain-containing protein [Deltaproteobacteria bacterium]MBW2110823.1 PilZ domain-containing protein [Deltaproteobacteria bacterium]HDZ91164.1 hypothetical protein [Deltaproteobacteria bacterium]
MEKMENGGHRFERRSHPRRILDRFFSVEFSIDRVFPIHQFRVRDVSPTGLGILVNENSAVLTHLKVGDVIEVRFNPKSPSDPPESFRAEISHITRMKQGPYKGHYLVGILVLEGNPDAHLQGR